MLSELGFETRLDLVDGLVVIVADDRKAERPLRRHVLKSVSLSAVCFF